MPDKFFVVKNEVTGEEIKVNSSANLRKLSKLIDGVTGDIMEKKAESEQNPERKKMMQLFARRYKELHPDQ